MGAVNRRNLQDSPDSKRRAPYWTTPLSEGQDCEQAEKQPARNRVLVGVDRSLVSSWKVTMWDSLSAHMSCG